MKILKNIIKTSLVFGLLTTSFSDLNASWLHNMFNKNDANQAQNDYTSIMNQYDNRYNEFYDKQYIDFDSMQFQDFAKLPYEGFERGYQVFKEELENITNSGNDYNSYNKLRNLDVNMMLLVRNYDNKYRKEYNKNNQYLETRDKIEELKNQIHNTYLESMESYQSKKEHDDVTE